MRTAKVAKRVAAALTVAVALVTLTTGTATAQTVPPGWNDLGDGAYVIFSMSDTAPPPTDHSGALWGPVTISRQYVGPNVEDAFSNWEDRLGIRYWPTDLNAGGISLARADDGCLAASEQCSYYVTGGAGTEFFLATASQNADGSPNGANLGAPSGPLQLDAPFLDVQFNSEDLRPVKGVDGQPGSITLDASGTTDNVAGPLSFQWEVTDPDGVKTPYNGPVVTVPVSKDGVFVIDLIVTNGNFSRSFDDPYVASVIGAAPDAVTPGPTPGGPGPPVQQPGPTPTPQNPPPANVDPSPLPAIVDPVVFTPIRSVPAALDGGSNGAAQVIWLWRPDFFQPGELRPREPQTATPPQVKGRQSVVVSTNDPTPDSSATPWLAGLAAFGLAAFVLMAMRRRRLHHLDP